ncbi:DUF6415 family natural product biosynthesis protein [Streptomyces sp. NPDC052225]|uniref:DUF6415 family natural product biosynthesis protein n=1 Tax=Streptomyces sp. NPDC052225 TaxID=3154949 RepID=UPI00342C5209
MPTHTPAPSTADRTPVPELLSAAFSAIRERPDLNYSRTLNHQLRAEIRRLLPKVQAQMDAITPRTRAWYARDKAIDLASQELDKGISPSPLAAYMALSELGRRLHELDEFAGGEV